MQERPESDTASTTDADGTAYSDTDDRWAQTPTLISLRLLIQRATAVHRHVAKTAGLSDHDLAALEILSHEALGPAELSRRLDVSTPAGTGIVDRLEARGHVERRPGTDDRRRVGVHVTDSGRTEITGHLRPMFQALAAMDADLDAADREVVSRYLQRAIAAFEAVGRDPGEGA